MVKGEDVYPVSVLANVELRDVSCVRGDVILTCVDDVCVCANVDDVCVDA